MENEIANQQLIVGPTGSYYSEATPIEIDMGSTAAGLAGIGMGLTLFSFIVSVGSYALSSWLLGRVFKKFGEKPGLAWIPIYNMWKFLELGGQKGFWMLVPGANLIFTIIAANNLGKKLGKSDAFVLLYIFLAPIWLIIIGSKDNPVVANSAESITPENQFGQQPVPQPIVNQPAPVVQDFSAPVAPEPTAPEESQMPDNTNQPAN